MTKYKRVNQRSCADCTVWCGFKFNFATTIKEFIENEFNGYNYITVSILENGSNIFDALWKGEVKNIYNTKVEGIPIKYINSVITDAKENGGYGNTHFFLWINTNLN